MLVPGWDLLFQQRLEPAYWPLLEHTDTLQAVSQRPRRGRPGSAGRASRSLHPFPVPPSHRLAGQGMLLTSSASPLPMRCAGHYTGKHMRNVKWHQQPALMKVSGASMPLFQAEGRCQGMEMLLSLPQNVPQNPIV